MIQRTISAMVGKGSINHNCRKFTAENVDPSRSHLNEIIIWVNTYKGPKWKLKKMEV